MLVSKQVLSRFVSAMRNVGAVDRFIDLDKYDPNFGYEKQDNPFVTKVVSNESLYCVGTSDSDVPDTPDNLLPLRFNGTVQEDNLGYRSWSNEFTTLEGIESMRDFIGRNVWVSKRLYPLPSWFENRYEYSNAMKPVNKFRLLLKKFTKKEVANFDDGFPPLPEHRLILNQWNTCVPEYDKDVEEVWGAVVDDDGFKFTGPGRKVDTGNLWSTPENISDRLIPNIHRCVGLRNTTRKFDVPGIDSVSTDRLGLLREYHFVYINESVSERGYCPKVGSRIRFIINDNNIASLDRCFRDEVFIVRDYKEYGSIKIIRVSL